MRNETPAKPTYEELLDQVAQLQQQHASLLELTQMAEALRKTEERHRLALAAGAMATWDWHVPSGEVVWNEEHFRMLGYEPGSIAPSYRAWAERVHPEDRAATENMVQANVEQGGEYRAEFRMLRPDGTVRWVEARGRTERDAAKKPLRQYGVMLDITELKRTEEVLRRYELLAGESRDIVLFMRSEDGRILEANSAAQNAYGYSREEMLSLSIRDLRASDTKSLTKEQMAIADARGILFETVHRRKDGSTFPVEVSSRGATINGARTLTSLVRDITDRKRAEEVLRASERLYRAIGESVDYGIWVCAPDGRNTYASESFLKLVGMTQEQCSNFGWGDVLHPDDAERTIAAWKECVRTGGTWDIEHRCRGVDGKWHPILARGAPVKDERGQITGWAGINLDISHLKHTEERLRENEQQLRDIIDGSPTSIVFLKDLEGRFITINKRLESLLGTSREALRGKTDYDIFPSEKAEYYREHDRRIIETGEALTVEEVADLADGKRHTFLASKFPLRDPSGRLYGVGAVSQDISQVKEAEEGLRRRVEEVETLMQVAPVAIWVANDPECRDIVGNRKGNEFYEADEGENVSAGPAPGTPVPPRRFFMGGREVTADELPMQLAAAQNVDVVGSEFDVVLSSGLRRTLSGNASPLRNSEGKVRGCVGAFVDITERKQAEEALAERKDWLELAMGAARIGAWHWDIVEDKRVFDNQVCRLLGIDSATFTGSSEEFFRTVHPEDVAKLKDALAKTVHDDAPYMPEYRAVWPDGTLRQVVAQGRLVRDDAGQPKRILGVLFDITERKQAEDALREANARLIEEDRRRSEFLGVLSHELRNPLTPVRNSLYVLDRATPGGEQARRAHAVIDRQVGHLSRIVDDLLDVTRITRGKIRLQRTRLDLVDLVRRTVDDHRSLLEEHEVAVELPSEAIWIDGDPTRLAQVLGNLLHNAAKFTPEDGKVSVFLTQVRGRAILEVADTGMGIDADTRKRVFEPFAQADRSLDRSRGGLGLGLALVKGMVELHGGAVSAHSDGPGKGARFIIDLPVDVGGAVLRGAPPPKEAASKGRAVLIIEDNRDAADSLSEALALSGHRVVVAYDGETGLAKARELRPEVVLCDIGLPQMDGYAVARAFRADDALKSAFLVALSGYALPEDLQRAREAGFQRHLAKPPNLEKLEELLAEAPRH